MSRISLIHWIQQALESSQVQVKVCLRGNNLYILCERETCPDATAIAQALHQLLSKQAIADHLPADAAEIHRVVCYGRALGDAQPQWTRAIPLLDSLSRTGTGDSTLGAPSPERVAAPQYAESHGAESHGAESQGVDVHALVDPTGGDRDSADLQAGDRLDLTAPATTTTTVLASAPVDGAPELGVDAAAAAIAAPVITDFPRAEAPSADSETAPGGVSSPATVPAMDQGMNQGQAVLEQVAPEQANQDQGQPEAEAASSSRVPDPSVLALARQGHPTAIAHHLSQMLAGMGISIRAKLDVAAPSTAETAEMAEAPALQRLLILCESTYAPDSSLLADPIAQHLRQLELTQFRDAVVFGQVRGEQRPEWLVRIDLTPRDAMVREWARWGDVQAIAVCLNRHLADYGITLTAFLKETTLHLSCVGEAGAAPAQATVVGAIVPDLQALAPQGIQAAILYGVEEVLSTGSTASEESGAATESLDGDREDEDLDAIPGWVQVVELAAAESPQAVSTLTLAQQGDLPALTFLLTRLLNPDLEAALATGGIRVQVRHKGDLLHVLAEAPTCPRQDAVAPAVVRCLKPLLIEGVAGLRVYGRRSGQKQPLWSHAVDVSPRLSQRLAGEAQPDFAASESHVDELLPTSGAIVLWSDLPDDGLGASLRRLYAHTIEQVQRSLIRTQLFVPIADAGATGQLAPWQTDLETPAAHRWKVALVWVAIGGLFIVQLDWLLGAWLRLSEQQAAVAPEPTPTAMVPETRAIASPIPLPEMSLNQKPQAKGFNDSPFTRPGEESMVVPPSPEVAAGTPTPKPSAAPDLPASPLQAKASTILGTTEYPTFNSRQLNDQIQLYRRYLEIHGTPDVLVVGSSRALRGIDPVALETALAQQGYSGVKVFNFGINGATAQVVDLLVRQLLPQDQLPKLILFADGARAFNSGRQDITFNGIVASAGYQSLLAGKPPIPSAIAQADTPAPVADAPAKPAQPWHQQLNESLNQRVAGLSMLYGQRDRLKTKMREQFTAMLPQDWLATNVLADRLIDTSPAASASGTPPTTQDVADQVDIHGFLPLSMQFNPLTYYQKYARVPGDYDSDYEAFGVQGVQTEAMQSLAQYAQSRQITLVFVNLPLTQDYLDPVRKDHEVTFQQFMLQLATQNGFFYRNLGSFLPQPQYFSDPSHLNRYGAYVVSRQLAQDVMIPWQVTRDTP